MPLHPASLEAINRISRSQFYRLMLKAPLRNTRTSWGSVNVDRLRVFLTVWKDEIRMDNDKQYVLVRRKPALTTSPGYAERDIHLDLIRGGYDGFGVICTAKELVIDRPREIKSFNHNVLFRFGRLIELEAGTYAEIVDYVTVDQTI